MRNIKFRAWDKGLERFISPSFIYIGEDNEFVLVFDSGRDVEDWTPNKNVELMQYTGLKDKNGTEIYEGDVLRFDNEPESADIVEWGENHGAWVAIVNKQRWYEILSDLLDGYEIVGNIYENPELLEAKA